MKLFRDEDIAKLTVEVGDYVSGTDEGLGVEDVMERFGLARWLAEDMMEQLARTGEFEWAEIEERCPRCGEPKLWPWPDGADRSFQECNNCGWRSEESFPNEDLDDDQDVCDGE